MTDDTITAAEGVKGWNPITTAPKDGSEFLGWSKEMGHDLIVRERGEWVCEWGTPRNPTHWMALTVPTQENPVGLNIDPLTDALLP